MCTLPNVKKHEKTFALNVDIFSAVKKIRNMLNFFADNHIIEKKIGQVIKC